MAENVAESDTFLFQRFVVTIDSSIALSTYSCKKVTNSKLSVTKQLDTQDGETKLPLERD